MKSLARWLPISTLMFSVHAHTTATTTATAKPPALDLNKLSSGSGNDAFFQGLWSKIHTDSDDPVKQVTSMLSKDLGGAFNMDSGELLQGIFKTLNSLDDSNEIYEAMRVYSDEYYNRLAFWSWVHRLSKRQYERAMKQLQFDYALKSKRNHDKNRELLLRLFHFMTTHYKGSTFSRMVKTLVNNKKFLNAALNAVGKKSAGSLSPQNPSIQHLVQQFGNQGKLPLHEINQLLQKANP